MNKFKKWSPFEQMLLYFVAIAGVTAIASILKLAYHSLFVR
jgi:hypothetical protein